MSNKVIITGANGFIGNHIVKLFSNNGIKVTCLVRKDSSLEAIKDFNVEYQYGDIRERQSLIDAFKEQDFVIHNAAYAKDWGSYDTFYQTNVVGTLNVLDACVENGVQEVIITGTNAVYGEENSVNVKDEDSPYNSHYRYLLDAVFPSKLNYYRDTKCIATQKAIEFAKQKGVNLTVLEPVWVYGEEGLDTVFLQYLKSAEEGIFFSPGTRKNKFHVVYAGDLAQAYYLAYTKRLKGIHRIIIGDHACEYMDNIFSLFCQYAGVEKPRLLSKWMVYPLGLLLEMLYTIFNVKNPPLLTRGRVNMFYDNIEYSTHKAELVLGFRSRISLSEGIKNTVNWYKQQAG
ncbi:MAG: NAD-dependent epimerase/dehydratase family protein [Candidatus Omnitrophica bacterium]|nr:NAD-dependent epimerase/dehydratase family protein [Candidatus Omnitrophota bacterium]MBU4467658.1 NAD-dependent epimerase/dehydratase family protein [Candidatus Omnitrophota bacterium]MCG2707482.1 NAD-dependent epimerase/dehydratase family protein [Candidatus Omnitrophota bacterium]